MTQWACASAAAPAGATASTPAPAEAADPSRSIATIADASAACARVQANQDLPVSCATDYVDSVPSMIVGFRSTQDARQYFDSFAQQLGDPFCEAANRSSREARVYVTIGNGPDQRARMWSCELSQWGDWFGSAESSASAPEASDDESSGDEASPGADAEDAPSGAPAQTIADSIRACNDMQQNRQMPVSCRTDYVNGVTSMMLGFPTPAVAEQYLDQLTQTMGSAFCAAANRANRHAAVVVNLGNLQARLFDCEQQAWSDWFELPQAKSAGRNSL